MNSENKIQIIGERIKAFAIGLIGSLFFSLGFSYFSEQSHYRVPRVLLPVYEYLGNVGLAIGLIVLGGGLMFWAYKKFKDNAGKPVVMIVALVVFLITAFGIVQLT